MVGTGAPFLLDRGSHTIFRTSACARAAADPGVASGPDGETEKMRDSTLVAGVLSGVFWALWRSRSDGSTEEASQMEKEETPGARLVTCAGEATT